jgi:hypothetical protein
VRGDVERVGGVGGVTVVLKIFFNMRNVCLSIRSGSENVDDVFYMETGDENQYRALPLEP